MREPQIYDFLGQSYARARREVHQRRATLISPPTASLFVCINRPGNWKETFRPFLRAILEQLNDAAPGSAERPHVERKFESFIENAVRHYSIAPDAGEPDGSSGLTLEIRDRTLERGIWRIEVLRQYVALTLHVGLDLFDDGKTYKVTLKGRGGDTKFGIVDQADTTHACPLSAARTSKRMAAPKLAKVLFDTLVTDLEDRLNPIMIAVRHFYIPEPEQASTITDDKKYLHDKVFALMFSLSVPWTVLRALDAAPDLRPGVPEVDPVFPKFDEPGFSRQDRSEAQRRTNQFLTQHWEALKGTLISENESDCVACYMQNGHCLFVSSLGSETTNPKEPVKYLMLYRDPETSAGGERGVSHETPCNFAWRQSRFISRVHDIGAARLRAFGHHEEISRFLILAKDLEFQLAERNLRAMNSGALQEIEAKFLEITHADTKDVPESERLTPTLDAPPPTMPITVRASQVQTQLGVMLRLCEDLGIIPLPAYQAYDHFLRRRVLGPLQRMISAGDRYQSILTKLNSASIAQQRRSMADQSLRILKIQQIADTVGLLIFTYYSMQGAYYVVDHFGPVLTALPLRTPWQMPGWLAHAAALLAGAAGWAFIMHLRRKRGAASEASRSRT